MTLAACTGTDTGNPPVIDFGNSGCHDQRYDKGITAVIPDPKYRGLTCLAFDYPEPHTLHVLLSNYVSSCASDDGWRPHAEYRRDGGLDIVLQDHNCESGNCGWCVYDLSFEIALERPLVDGELRVYQSGCGNGRRELRALLPFSQASGVACDYTHSVALDERGAGRGTRMMMCGAAGSLEAATCEVGTTCTDVGEELPYFDGGERCLPSCQSDADCDSLSRCDGVVCRLAATNLWPASTL